MTSRVEQYVPVKRVGTVISPKVAGDSISGQQFRPQINVETLSATRTLVTTDYMAQWLDPNGSDRDVILPAEASSTDILFIILNTANATGEDLVIKNDGASTIITIGPDQSAMLACDGTNWKLEDDVGMYYDGQASTSQLGHSFPGGVVVENYCTIGQASLSTLATLYVTGTIRCSSDLLTDGVLNTDAMQSFTDNVASIPINLVVSGADATDHKVKLQIDANDIFVVRATGQGDGTAADFIALLEQNDMWLAELNYAETDYINLLKVNVDDEIDVGGSLNLGTIEGPEDGGFITLADMPVSATPTALTKEAFGLKMDGDLCLAWGAFADSAGGVGGHFVQNYGAHFDKKTDMGAASYAPSALTSDYIITVDTSGAARTVVISTEDRDTGSATAPRIFIIKDIAGNAGANAITISLETSGNIDGAATAVINSNYGSRTICVDGTNGYIL